MKIVQEKYVAMIKDVMILTGKGFKKITRNPSVELKHSQVKLFNHPNEAELYTATRYGKDIEFKKVMVEITFLEEE